MRCAALLPPLLLLAACAGGRPSLRKNADLRGARLGGQIDVLRQRLAAPAMAAGVVVDGKLAWSRGFGEIAPGRPALDSTPFRVASVTKTFTSFLIMKLQAEGKLSLSDAVTVDTAPTRTDARRVLSHTSDDPSGAFRYNHERFKTLGPVIESAAGKPIRRVFEERIIIPFSMTDTAPGEDSGACPPFPDAIDDYMAARDARVLMTAARPYRVEKGLKAVPVEDAPGVLSAAGGMITSVRDLANFAAGLDPALMAPAFTPVRNSSGTANPYGLGWFVQTVRGVKIVWHYGEVADLASALFLLVPERKLAFIVLADTDGLSLPFDDALSAGDATGSPFVNEFLRIYVFEPAVGRPLRDPDWTLHERAFKNRLRPSMGKDYDYDGEIRAGAALRAWRKRMG
jgi:CubicO group peptidase (beta-lactamase class C family)